MVCGAAYSEEEIKIDGEYKSYTYLGGSGLNYTQDFCGNCGVYLFYRPEMAEGMIYVHAGVFDDQDAFEPKVELFCNDKSKWVGEINCLAESFTDNGTLQRLQMMMENIDQRV